MEVKDIGVVVAERVLTLVSDDGNPQQVIVRLGKPMPYENGQDFFCPYEVVGFGERKIEYASGLDAFQSLQLALRIIPSILQHRYQKRCDGRLHWLVQGDDLGFPEVL